MDNEKELMEKQINILRKIDSIDSLSIDLMPVYFNKIEIEDINTLIKQGKLRYVWDDFIPYKEEEKLVLTKFGEQMLFCANNIELILEFCKILDKLGYDSNFNLVMDFIATQNLKLNPLEILTINNFEDFSITYDRYIKKENIEVEQEKNNIITVIKLRQKLHNGN